MTEELARQEVKGIAVPVTMQTVKDFLFSSGTKLSEQQQAMFMQLAMRNQLDPFKREIYAIAYGSNFNIVTGYQVYIQRAEASGKLDGWECSALHNHEGGLYGATITIYRKDFSHPFVWEVALAEFDKGVSGWKTMPEFLIKKVAIGQGFRLAFPNELAGMPYLQEELEGLTQHTEKASGKPTTAAPQKKSETAATGELQELVGLVEAVTFKEGNSKGKAWTLYTIKVTDTSFTTFDKKHAEYAKEAKEIDQPVKIEYTVGEKGNTLVSIKVEVGEEVGAEGRSEQE